MAIWVTRSAPDNLWTARRLRSAGYRALVAPVSQIQSLTYAPMQMIPELIVFSSIHAVRNHVMDPVLAQTPVLACGDRVAEAATAAGYGGTTSLGNSESMLMEMIAASQPTGTRIGYFCSDYTSHRFETVLGEAGMQIQRRSVYRAEAVSGEARVAAEQALLRVRRILVHSAPAAERIRSMLCGTGWSGTLCCISPASAAAFEGMGGVRVIVAREPTEEALIAAIRDSGARRPTVLPANDNR